MKYRVEIREEQDEDIVILAKRRSDILLEIESMIGLSDEPVLGYLNDEAVRLDLKNVFCFYTESGRVYAQCKEGSYLVKERLYRLEALAPVDFIKINQSCLVNVTKIKRFKSSIGGALLVILDNGFKDYISRRQLKAVKERMGLK